MKSDLLEKAVTQDLDQTLLDVCKIAYTLEIPNSLELVEIALKTNRKLGYDLFEDLYTPSLIRDFATVALAVQVNAFRTG